MKAIAIVGDHNSGKTTLGKKIVKILKDKGYEPIVYKHTPRTEHFADEGKDTEQYLSVADAVVATGKDAYAIYVRGHLPLHKLFALMRDLGADFLVYEGTPQGLLIPWIKVGTGKGDSPYTLWYVEDPMSFTDAEVEELVDDILKRAWTIPMMLNCGKCGVDTCQEYVDAILSGEEKTCVLWDSKMRIIVNGKEVPLVPFIEKLYRSVIESLVDNLKGVPKDYNSVEIYLGRESHED